MEKRSRCMGFQFGVENEDDLVVIYMTPRFAGKLAKEMGETVYNEKDDTINRVYVDLAITLNRRKQDKRIKNRGQEDELGIPQKGK